MTRFATWLVACAVFAVATTGCVVRTAVPVGPPPPEPVYYPPQPMPAPVVVEESVYVPTAPPPPQREYIPMQTAKREVKLAAPRPQHSIAGQDGGIRRAGLPPEPGGRNAQQSGGG